VLDIPQILINLGDIQGEIVADIQIIVVLPIDLLDTLMIFISTTQKIILEKKIYYYLL